MATYIQVKALGGECPNNKKPVTVLLCQNHIPALCAETTRGTLLANKRWLEDCIKDGVRHHPHEHVYYAPHPLISPGKNIFKSLTISQSSYKGEERAFITTLLKALGAKVTDTFGRNNSHLICKAPSGNKYHSAIHDFFKPVITAQWVNLSSHRIPYHALSCSL